jgi:hypothetical protein
MTDLLQTKLNPELEILKQQKGNYKFAYTPLPISPIPSSPTDITKDITITPIGTFTPNDSGLNEIGNLLMKLPSQQTPESCIVNAAAIRSNYIPVDTLDDNIYGKFTPNEIEVTLNVAVKSVTGTDKVVTYKTVTDITKVNYVEYVPMQIKIPGLHFRVAERYEENNVNIFSKAGVKISMDTNAYAQKNMIKDTQFLPTDYTNLQTAVTTNFTDNGSTYNIVPNGNNKHYFIVEWYGMIKVDETGNWGFSLFSDDHSFIWIGDVAVSGYTVNNSTINDRNLHGMAFVKNTIQLVKDTYYPIRMQFGENGGWYDLQLRAYSPSGRVISNFKDFFSSTVMKNQAVTKTKEVPVQRQEEVNTYNNVYSTTATQTKKTLSDAFNQSYTTTDTNAMYVSMAKDGSTGKYDCYVTPLKGTNAAQINTLLTKGSSNSIYNVVNLWQSTVVGDVYNSYCSLGEDAGVYIDGKTPLSMISAGNPVELKDGGLPETHYMYIIDSTDGPHILVKKINKDKTTQINEVSIDIKTTYNKYKDYKIGNKTWFYEQGRYLVYDSTNPPNNKDLGRLYKTTTTDYIMSNTQSYRLIMYQGRLTLQMAIKSQRVLGTNPNIQYVDKDIAPNTYPLMKIDVDHKLNQVHLLNKTTNSTYYVPPAYTTLDPNNYTAYDAYPNLTAGGAVLTKSADVCKSDCSKDPACQAVYSYTDNAGTTLCKTQNIGDPTDPGVFNPKTDKIKSSKLYVKNKKVDDRYNSNTVTTPFIDIENIAFKGNETTTFTKSPYYPDAPDKNGNNSFDGLKHALAAKQMDINSYLSNPDTILNTASKNYVVANVAGTETFVSGAANYSGNIYNSATMNSTRPVEGYTALSDASLSSMCAKNPNSNYGVCLLKGQIESANKNYSELKNNDSRIYNNYQSIVGQVNSVDSQYKNMAKINTTGVNQYNADFNDFDDSPDRQILNAIQKDTNILLLNHNTMNIVGTIATASLVILAIILARQ